MRRLIAWLCGTHTVFWCATRQPKAVEFFLTHESAVAAGLSSPELIALRLYTGRAPEHSLPFLFFFFFFCPLSFFSLLFLLIFRADDSKGRWG